MDIPLLLTLGEFGIKEIIIIALLLLIPYFIPTIIAYAKNRENKSAIMLINVFLGWTAIGWVGSLIWACMADKNNNNQNIL